MRDLTDPLDATVSLGDHLRQRRDGKAGKYGDLLAAMFQQATLVPNPPSSDLGARYAVTCLSPALLVAPPRPASNLHPMPPAAGHLHPRRATRHRRPSRAGRLVAGHPGLSKVLAQVDKRERSLGASVVLDVPDP